jgi:L-fucose isomerase-like protein
MARFVVGFGNRAFFPPKYMSEARSEMASILRGLGHEAVMSSDALTRLGAVETPAEGKRWAEWLDGQQGRYDGIIWTHPNFGDESGMLPALQKAGKRGDRILIHAYPDRLDKLGLADRRDAFCGVISTMDVLVQYGIPFIKLAPHVVAPSSPRFAENVALFAKICRREAADPFVPATPMPAQPGENVLDGLTLLAVGARTSPFKTCRYDELAAAKNGISIETQDLALVMHRMRQLPHDGPLQAKMTELGQYTCWSKAHEADPEALEKQARFAIVMDRYLEEFEPDAVAVRCWTEWQEIMHMSVCATLSHLNHGRSDGRVVPAACEVDLGTALMMYVLHRYGGELVACQDWNNNFGDHDDRLMFMHCGPHDTRWLQPDAALMDARFPGHYVETQGILDTCFANGQKNWGCIQGRFKPGPVTVGGATIGPDHVYFYFLEGRVTDDVVPPEYFGSAGVMEIPRLQQALLQIGRGGYKHHFAMSTGHIADRAIAALRQHAGYQVTDLRMS